MKYKTLYTLTAGLFSFVFIDLFVYYIVLVCLLSLVELETVTATVSGKCHWFNKAIRKWWGKKRKWFFHSR